MRTLTCLLVSAVSAFAIAGSPQGGTQLPAEVSTLGNDCIIVGPLDGCAATNMQFSSSFSGTNYVWSLGSNSAAAVFCSVTNQQQVCVQPTQGGSYTLVLDYLFNGIPRNCSVVVNVHPALTIADLLSDNACTGDQVTFQTSVLTGDGVITFSWTYNDGSGAVPIVGANTDTYTIPSAAISDSGTYCVTASGGCGDVTSCAELSVTECGGDTFCTLTQGAYGSGRGYFNGVDRLTMITGLMSTDLVVGKPGRSLNLGSGVQAARCVIDRLPANSAPAALPDFGDETLDTAGCQTAPTALPLKNGRYKNNLLGQTITLALNTRLDPNLSGLGICASMTTQIGTDPLTQQTITISDNIIDALAALGLPQTVGGILELANRALANQALGGATIGEVNSAADAINKGFDECRTLVDCE